MEKKGRQFLGIYLLLAFVFGVLGLVDSSFSLFNFGSSNIYEFIVLFLGFAFLFFNIFAIIHFINNKLEKITLALPIYHILSYGILLFFGFVIGLYGLSNGMLFSLSLVGMLTSGFEIVFSIYLLKRFEFF